MSPDTERRRRRYSLRSQTMSILLLTVVWCFFSGNASLVSIISGLLLGLFITWAFPMPGISWAGRLRPIGIVVLAVRLLRDLAVASFTLALFAFRPKARPRSAVIAIRLRTDDDLLQVGTGSVLSIVPGSVVVDARRKTRTLYMHWFDTTPEGIAENKRHGLAVERAIVEAFGSSAQVRELRQADRDARTEAA